MNEAEMYIGSRATKIGYFTPDPPKPVYTCDTQDRIDKCLECPVEGGFDMLNSKCLLRETKTEKGKINERDEKVLSLLRSGWINIDAICEEAGISRYVYFNTKKRLRDRGLI